MSQEQSNGLAEKYLKVIHLVWEIHPITLLYSFLYALSITFIPYLDFWFLGSIVNDLTEGSQSNQLLLKVILFVILTYLLNVSSHYLQKKRDDAQSQLGMLLDEQVTKRLLTIDYANLEDPKMRENYQKAAEGTNYSGGIASFINQTLTSSFQLLVALVVSGVALVSLSTAKGRILTSMTWVNSWWFLVLILGVIMLPVIISVCLFKQANLAKFEQFNEIVEINREFTYFHHTVGHYQNGMTFRLYQGTKMFLKKVNQSNIKSMALFYKMEGKDFSYTGTVLFLASTVTALLYVIVGLKAFVGAIAIGSVILYAGYLQQLLAVLLDFFKAISVGNTIVTYIQYYYDFLYDDAPLKRGTLPVEKRDDNEYELEFHDVSFKYPRTSLWVLKDFSLRLKVGERVSVVGRNGSGKTTFIKLLCRLYEPTKGYITLNGIDLAKYDRSEYQRLLAVVFQDFKLFSFSVAENVSTNLSPDDQRVEKALEIAGIREQVGLMPQGTDTVLTKHLDERGIEVSGGEAQKIAIARAWYKDAPFVILDEPTSALDPVAEYDIYKRFDELIEDKTAIYISHRMSSARFSQRIIVFDEGRVVQDGNHDSLMGLKSGKYYELFTAQAKYYTESHDSDDHLKRLFSY